MTAIFTPIKNNFIPSDSDAIKASFYPEAQLAGFSHVDGTIAFYTQIAALLKSNDIVLEFGAGRGGNILTDPSPYRQWLQTLKGRCKRVEGCDVDPAVTQNPYLDAATVIRSDAPLPYPDATFDLILSNWVFEHIADPKQTSAELLRILKPGGTICASTPNKYGYVALMSRLVSNSHHVKMLSRIQPDRAAIDVFPTHYRMNTVGQLKKLFSGFAEVMVCRTSSDPSYHFNNRLVYRLFKILHKITPDVLATTLYVFVRKRNNPS